MFFIIFITKWFYVTSISPYPVLPHVKNMVLDGQIYLNPFWVDREILVHEMAHVIRGHGPRDGTSDPDHDELFWNVYNDLVKKYNID